MPLNAEQRAALLARSPELDSGEPSTALLDLASQHRGELLEELQAQPGLSQVRAMALRMLPSLVPDAAEREPLLAAAGRAVLAPVGSSASEQLSRHPAWIGLSVIELAALLPDWQGDPIERAVELAGAAFAVVGSAHELDDGEILWAMAEQASDAGWQRRSDELFSRALDTSFNDPVHRAQVRLLVALRREERGEPAAPLLALVAEDDRALDRDRVHASWILAHLRSESGDADGALQALRRADELVDRDEDPQVAQRIASLLQQWTA